MMAQADSMMGHSQLWNSAVEPRHSKAIHNDTIEGWKIHSPPSIQHWSDRRRSESQARGHPRMDSGVA